MKRMFFVFLFVCIIFEGNVFAYNNHGYPYSDSQCWLDGPNDPYGFRKANCTSYAAYMLNGYGVSFINGSYYVSSYNSCSQGNKWGHGGCWDDAARNAGIKVNTYPLPGDVAYWNTLGGVGHVAWVEKVYYDSSGNATSVDITEYNYNTCVWGWRNVSVGNPDGYIHILAYEEGVTGLHYLDCYEMGNLCDNQTHEEWGRIVDKVWRDYRCTNCTSNYDVAFINTTATGFGGGDGASGSSSGSTTLPDFIVNNIWLENQSGQTKTTFRPGETITMKAKIKNVGTDSPLGIEAKFYLSDGEEVDADKEPKETVNIDEDELENGETHTIMEELFAPSAPGTYNIVVCADTDEDVAEEHERNNCSDEAVLKVDDYSWLVPIINLILQ